ncbi:hypothetical protein ACTHTN_20350, partial [Neisseria sp. P0015.S006]
HQAKQPTQYSPDSGTANNGKNISNHNKLKIQFKNRSFGHLGRLKTKQGCLHVLLPNLRRGFQIPVVIKSTNPLRLERDK